MHHVASLKIKFFALSFFFVSVEFVLHLIGFYVYQHIDYNQNTTKKSAAIQYIAHVLIQTLGWFSFFFFLSFSIHLFIHPTNFIGLPPEPPLPSSPSHHITYQSPKNTHLIQQNLLLLFTFAVFVAAAATDFRLRAEKKMFHAISRNLPTESKENINYRLPQNYLHNHFFYVNIIYFCALVIIFENR